MRYLVITALLLLMLSVGMSLRPSELLASLRRLSPAMWLALLLVTFVIPPAAALILGYLFHLNYGQTVGLFLVGVAPGAPLVTRNVTQRGFDTHVAAGYQIWAALMIPIMVPLVVTATATAYRRDVAIPIAVLLSEIASKQLLPLALGMLGAWLAPQFTERIQPWMNRAGNIVLLFVVVMVVYALGPALKTLTMFVPVCAVLLSLICLGSGLSAQFADESTRRTLAISSVNRNVGLAFVLSRDYFGAKDALGTLVCYALLAPVVMLVYAKLQKKPASVVASAGK